MFRVPSRRECASPPLTPRAPSALQDGCGETPLALSFDDDGSEDASKRKGHRSLTLANLWTHVAQFMQSPAASLPRVGSSGSFSFSPSTSSSSSTTAAATAAASSSSSSSSAAPLLPHSIAGEAGSGASTPPTLRSPSRIQRSTSSTPGGSGGPGAGACSGGGSAGSLASRLPCALALVVLVVTFFFWEWAPARHTPDPSLPTHIPLLAIPTSPGRGPSLLATLRSLEAPIDTLLLCNSAPHVPEVECLLEEVAHLAEAGELRIKRVRVVAPASAPGPIYGVAECWNAMVDVAFGEVGVPWVLVLNDDVGMPAGTLGAALEEVWRTHQRHSLLLANEGLPGVGYAFSAFVLTRAGRAALGSFDENFFPAYYEVSARGTLFFLCVCCCCVCVCVCVCVCMHSSSPSLFPLFLALPPSSPFPPPPTLLKQHTHTLPLLRRARAGLRLLQACAAAGHALAAPPPAAHSAPHSKVPPRGPAPPATPCGCLRCKGLPRRPCAGALPGVCPERHAQARTLPHGLAGL
jgi:hypothetical protein